MVTTDKLTFTHYWVTGFGWENTAFIPDDFIKVEKLGETSEGVIYIAFNKLAGKHIFLNKINNEY